MINKRMIRYEIIGVCKKYGNRRSQRKTEKIIEELNKE